MLKRLALILLKFYKIFISPILGSNCRFYPTCSIYAYKAIERHGLLKGILLGFKRIIKCNPFYPGGIDEVPE